MLWIWKGGEGHLVAERSSARELRCPKCFWCRNKVARNSEPLCPPAFLNNQERKMPVPGQTPAWAESKRFRQEVQVGG